jgi:ribosomal protein S18 acetylase RimI-like enzyme
MPNPFILASAPVDELRPLISRAIGSTVLPLLGSAGGDAAEGERYALELVAADIEAGALEVVAVERKRRLSGALIWKINSWDTEVLGTVCANLLLVAGEARRALIAFWRKRAISCGVRYATCRVVEGVRGPDDEMAAAWNGTIGAENELPDLLLDEGFTRLETLVFLRRPSRVPRPVHEVHCAGAGDIEPIARIARSSYTFDRFHRDPFFPDRAADALHERWARNSCRRPHGSVLTVRSGGNQVLGYASCLIPPSIGRGQGWIDMLAVTAAQRRNGYGESLVRGALRYFKAEGLGCGALSTQEHNAPAAALYRKLGFTPYGVAATYRLVL